MLSEAAAKGESKLARIHAMWALGQIAEKNPEALKAVVAVMSDPDAEIRAQAARLLGDHHAAEDATERTFLRN